VIHEWGNTIEDFCKTEEKAVQTAFEKARYILKGVQNGS
jgi:hypothetical protein